MTSHSLRDFLEFLRTKNDLLEISHSIATKLEMTEVAKRFLADDGPALLFKNAVCDDGEVTEIPVLTNLFASERRIIWGLGLGLDEARPSTNLLKSFGKELAFFKNPKPPTSLSELKKLMPLVRRASKMRPEYVKKAECQELVLIGEDIDLTKLPIQTCWPKDASPLITWPLVVTLGTKPDSDETDGYNLGIYRMQLLDKKRCLMRWLKHRGGAAHFRKWQKDGLAKIPVAVVLGADPATTLAAVMPIPDNMSEYHFSGLLRNSRLKLVKCKTVPLFVPANAEIVIEGYVSTSDFMNEGPFGDHTGYYNAAEPFPVFTATAITSKKAPIYLSTYTGKPPDEPSVLGLALGYIVTPLLIEQFSEITDFHLPEECCSYRIAIVSIKKTYPGQAQRVAMGIWSFLKQFTYTKIVIVVDDGIDIRNWREVMWAVSTMTDPARDNMIVNNTPIDYLDFASTKNELGGKLCIDATSKIYPETDRAWGEAITMDEATIARIDQIWSYL